AMSMKYLGEQIDIHTGGEDHLSIHHPNEIAQSEGATGKKPFSKFWIHSAFLTVDGTKMSKSLGNYFTIEDIIAKGYNPIALRYLYLGAHYKKPMNFTWQALDGALKGLKRLQQTVNNLQISARTILSEEKNQKMEDYRIKFNLAINDDLNTSKAMAVMFEMLKSNIPNPDKYDLAIFFDEVLGLRLKV
ncbi:MAG: Cysteine-tRNA ligase, partial [Microgenomates group bacterium GW2011_GWD1_33_9]